MILLNNQNKYVKRSNWLLVSNTFCSIMIERPTK